MCRATTPIVLNRRTSTLTYRNAVPNYIPRIGEALPTVNWSCVDRDRLRWRLHQTRRATCHPFRVATASGRCRAREDRSRDGARDGEELFYVSADGRMMAVAVMTGASFEAGSAVALFQTHRPQRVSTQDVFSYDVSCDGQKFLIITKVDEANPAPLSILLNWASEMEK